jgi:hypothetical protein
MAGMDTSTRSAVHGLDADLRRELVRSLATPVGGAVAMTLAICLIPVRSHLSRPLTLLPFAALVIVVSIVGGARSGSACAVVAGMAIDSFLHRPYGVLDLGQWAFWSSTIGLVVAALVAGARPSRSRWR